MLRRLAHAAVLLVLSLVMHAQPALVAHTYSNTGLTPTSPINTTGANLYLVCTYYNRAPSDDSGTNVYSLIATFNPPGADSIYMWASYLPATSTTRTFSGSNGGSAMTIAAFSGVATFDQSAGKQGLSSPAITPTNGHELVFPCMSWNYTTTPSVTVNSPYTYLDSGYDTDTTGMSDAYVVQGSSPSSTTATFTSNGSAGGGPSVLTAAFFADIAPATLAVTSTSPLPEAVVGTAYSTTLTASGGVPPYTWSKASGTIPAGLSLASSGVISGTPTTASTPSAVYTVTDSASSTANSSSLTLPVASTLLTVTTSSCPSGTQYQAYSGCTFAATGGIGSYTWSAVVAYGVYTSTPPEGLTITGNVLGSTTGNNVVTGQGTYYSTYVATDSYGATATSIIPISINSVGTLTSDSFFPSDSIFHQRVDGLAVDTSPAAPVPASQVNDVIEFLGDLTTGGIPWSLQVPNATSFVSVGCNVGNCGTQTFTSAPFPPLFNTEPIEGTQNASTVNANPNPPPSFFYYGDGHCSLFQHSSGASHAHLFEMAGCEYNVTSPVWLNSYSSDWDMSSYTMPPQGQSSTDAAGLPIAPLLYTYAEALAGTINHPGRFTIGNSSHLGYYVWPATSQATNGGSCTGGYEDGNRMISQVNNAQTPGGPPASCSTSMPYGENYRLKANVAAPAACAGNTVALNLIAAWKQYGMDFADGGEPGHVYVTGADDPRWNVGCIGTGSDKLILNDFEPTLTGGQAVNLLNSYQVTSGGSGGSSMTGGTMSGGTISH